MTTKDDQINEEEQNSKVEETVENTDSENTDQTEETTEESEEDTLQNQYDELNKKYMLLYSDFDNFRKRSIKEKAEIISTASGSVIKDVLGTLDDFERAIANNEKVEDIDMLKDGFKLIHQKLLNTLVAKGLEPMNAKGEVFDADKHEAITQIPAPTEDDKGKCVDVVERGYNLKGHVLRYAKVVVGQ